MDEDLIKNVVHNTKKHRYVMVYLIFKPQGAILNGRVMECIFGADCLEDITKRQAQLECMADYVGIVGLKNITGDWV